MFLAASDICYLQVGAETLSCSEGTNKKITDVSRQMAEQGDRPNIQVVEKDGHWFALNSSQLDLCKMLERDGKCDKIRVEVVSMKQVPEDVRRMMVIPESEKNDSNRKGYRRLQSAVDGSNSVRSESFSEDDDDDDDSNSNTSELNDTSSECDWSECLESTEDDDDDTDNYEEEEEHDDDGEVKTAVKDGAAADNASTDDEEKKSLL